MNQACYRTLKLNRLLNYSQSSIRLDPMAKETAAEIGTKIQEEIFYRMTPAQRLRAAEQLYWSARQLKAATIQALHPELDQEQVQQKVKEIFMYARS